MKKQKSSREVIATETSKIPHFASIEEEAEFWDTHDFTDFEDEFEDVDTSDHIPMSTFGVFLTDEERTIIDTKARALNMRPWRLAKQWILEGLARETSPKKS
jgi:hypothetical protein